MALFALTACAQPKTGSAEPRESRNLPPKNVPAAVTPHWQLPAHHVNHDKYYERRATHFGTLPVDADDIIMLGNSLTDGAEFAELFGNVNVKNRGIVGDIIPGYIDRLEPITSGHPAKIFILGGVNDVSHGVSGDSIARSMERLVVLIKQQSPETKIYVQSMLPFNNDVQMWKYLKDREQVVVDGNKALERMCRRQGVTWIDLYPLFDDGNGKLRPEYTNDGLHLMGEAYLVWRDALLPYINE
ncbi:MAG: sialate O-acetylesterase [Muribaculaceae bacterium]|nr:sialate O-acetylesterase [Muribaculaceae bacterium]